MRKMKRPLFAYISATKVLLTKYLPEIKTYYFHFRKSIPVETVRLVIFGQGRTGSTLLEDLLCSTGHFHANGELLSKLIAKTEIKFPYYYISGRSKKRHNENFIFHVKIYHLTRDRKAPVNPARFLEKLYKDGWKIVYLKRKNKILHRLSNELAKSTGQIFKYDDSNKKVQIQLDLDSFKKGVEDRFKFEKEEIKALANVDYHQVIYEDDLENSDSHQKTINSILDFVSLKRKPIITSLRKNNTHSLKDLIINYDEFYNLLKENGWVEFLND
jgi:hypothetical protein